MLLVPALPGAADFEAGQRAFEAGDFNAAQAEWMAAGLVGDSRAQYELGLMLADGTGVPRDVISAYAWLMLAHKGGVADAKGKYTTLQRDYIPRYCHYDALMLVRQFETGHPERLAEGNHQNSRCWRMQRR
jgi:TPR repeat protein